ncbi:hypothetical protein Dda_1507 [Drechslerella dactyloides]|uniref:RING-type domain-containing protein n=1 Tax=Drechslerella dactyloides TaxID=74499 RepID=A0AAD6J1U9_DREDA|nr:hypothetical protein Dda_1507 [Drechslerella dactyloides]
MRYPAWLSTAAILLLMPAAARPPDVPEWENFAFEIQGDAIVEDENGREHRSQVAIFGQDSHDGTRIPESCYKLYDFDTGTQFRFYNVRRLGVNVNYYDDRALDQNIIWEFFRDDDCLIENAPRMLVRSGLYNLPTEGVEWRIGSFRLIDPLALRFMDDERLTRVTEAEEARLLRTQEEWDRARRLFEDVREDLLSGASELECPICQLPLAREEITTTWVGYCSHSYHPECMTGLWQASFNPRRRDPEGFLTDGDIVTQRGRTGFRLSQVVDCPQCRRPLNLRQMARIPTQRVDPDAGQLERQPGDQAQIPAPNENQDPNPQIIQPQGQGNLNINPNVADEGVHLLTPPRLDNRDRLSSGLGPPSIQTTPGSELDEFLDYYTVRERANIFFNPMINRDRAPNPFIGPVDFTSDVREVPMRQGIGLRLPDAGGTNPSPLVEEGDFYEADVGEGISSFNGITRSLLRNQLG